MIEVIEVFPLSNSKDRKEFINLPWSLYASQNSAWIPPLKLQAAGMLKESHPFFNQAKGKFWIAKQNGCSVGRIAAFTNKAYDEFHGEEVGFFGFFDSVDDQEISKPLFETVESFFRQEKVDSIQGPINYSTNYEMGLLVDGFDEEPAIMMNYNHPYYADLIQSADYKKAKDVFAYDVPINVDLPEKVKMVVKKVEQSENISYRPVNLKKWDQEIKTMFDIYNKAWEKNWGFVPMSESEFLLMAKEMKSIVNPNLILFASVKGRDVGFIIALPDFNQVLKHIPNGKLFPTGILKVLNAKKYIDKVRVITLGLLPEYRKRGLASLLYVKIQKAALENNYTTGEMGWVLEDNVEMTGPIEKMGARKSKTYRIFEKTL